MADLHQFREAPEQPLDCLYLFMCTGTDPVGGLRVLGQGKKVLESQGKSPRPTRRGGRTHLGRMSARHRPPRDVRRTGRGTRLDPFEAAESPQPRHAAGHQEPRVPDRARCAGAGSAASARRIPASFAPSRPQSRTTPSTISSRRRTSSRKSMVCTFSRSPARARKISRTRLKRVRLMRTSHTAGPGPRQPSGQRPARPRLSRWRSKRWRTKSRVFG